MVLKQRGKQMPPALLGLISSMTYYTLLPHPLPELMIIESATYLNLDQSNYLFSAQQLR